MLFGKKHWQKDGHPKNTFLNKNSFDNTFVKSV
jgi:hypothetical protein